MPAHPEGISLYCALYEGLRVLLLPLPLPQHDLPFGFVIWPSPRYRVPSFISQPPPPHTHTHAASSHPNHLAISVLLLWRRWAWRMKWRKACAARRLSCSLVARSLPDKLPWHVALTMVRLRWKMYRTWKWTTLKVFFFSPSWTANGFRFGKDGWIRICVTLLRRYFPVAETGDSFRWDDVNGYKPVALAS